MSVLTRIEGIGAAAAIAIFFGAAAIPESLSQPLIAGVARVIDGDTLEVFTGACRAEPVSESLARCAGTRVRIQGIDAPEMGQMCGVIHCGVAAKARLAELIGSDIVTCKPSGLDRYGRTLAQCATARSRDLGESMVSTGYAKAYRRYSQQYVDAEEAAKAERAGLWATGDFGDPEAWRHKR